MNDENSLVHNRGPRVSLRLLTSRFASLEGSVQTFIEEQENQNTVKKTERDVALLTEFLQTKREPRSEIAEIPPTELNELLSEFILSVRTKEGQDYEPSVEENQSIQRLR